MLAGRLGERILGEKVMRERVRGGSWIGLAVLTLLLAGCGVVAANPGGGPVSGHATPTAVPALAWRQATLPAGFDPQHWGQAVSPVDGRDAWLCAPGQGDDFTIWATHDTAVTWAPVGSIVVATPEPGSCTLVADQGSVSALVAGIMWGSGEAGTLRSMSLISADSGVHWRALPGEMQVMEVGSVPGKTYAILHDTAAAAPAAQQSGLMVSVDGLHTWRAIRPATLPANDALFQFWLGPAVGDLAAATVQNTLWHSDDAGASWSRLSTPDRQTSLGAWLPRVGQWLFCAGEGTPVQLTCSTDLGKSWQQKPTFSSTLHCASCGKNGAPYSVTQPCLPSEIAADGSLLADCPATNSAPTWAGSAEFTLYRLAPNALAWITLGAAPAQWLTLSASGKLWCWDPQGGRLFVAMLPF